MTRTAKQEGKVKLIKVVVLSTALLVAAAPGMAQARDGHGGHRGYGGHERHFGGFDWGLGVVAALIAIPLIAASSVAPPHYAPAPASSDDDYGPPYAEPTYSQPAYMPPAYAGQYQAPVQQQTNAWYFCPSANGYYPYIRQCPGGWQRVSPTPLGY
jgi:hypothetical protein